MSSKDITNKKNFQRQKAFIAVEIRDKKKQIEEGINAISNQLIELHFLEKYYSKIKEVKCESCKYFLICNKTCRLLLEELFFNVVFPYSTEHYVIHKTKEGKKINLLFASDEHLINLLSYMYKNNKDKLKTLLQNNNNNAIKEILEHYEISEEEFNSIERQRLKTIKFILSLKMENNKNNEIEKIKYLQNMYEAMKGEQNENK